MDTLYRQFKDSLKRESKIIKGYYNNTEYQCLFRRNPDANSKDNHITIYYDFDAGIYKGQLLTYGNSYYLVLNQETPENGVYYKSSCIECNVRFPFVKNGINLNIPAYSPDLSSLTVNESNTITTLDGYGKLMTEYTSDFTQSALVNKTYFIMDWWFTIINRYKKDGLVIMGLKLDLEPAHTYRITTTAPTNAIMQDDTVQLETEAYYDEVIQIDATFSYSSSDESIATVDSNGIVTGISGGSVVITATWNEYPTTTNTFNIEVTATEVTYHMNLVVSGGSDYISIGVTRTFTVTLYDSSNNVISFTPTWTFNYSGIPTSKVTLTYPTTYQCGVKVANDDTYVGYNFTVICTDNATGTTISKTVGITY